jgi:hypothetical protein
MRLRGSQFDAIPANKKTKVLKTLFQSISGHIGGICHPQVCERMRSGRSKIQASLGKKKACDHISTREKLGMVVHACHISFFRKPKIGSWSRPAWAK